MVKSEVGAFLTYGEVGAFLQISSLPKLIAKNMLLKPEINRRLISWNGFEVIRFLYFLVKEILRFDHWYDNIMEQQKN
jgi:hypothetical protein